MIETLTLADLCQSKTPLALPPEAPVSQALADMAAGRHSAVVVTAEGCPVGIFTERDALGLVARDRYAPETPLRDLMSSALVTASPQMTFVEGYARMAGQGLRHLVLTDAPGRLCGLVSETDFAQALGAEELLAPRTVADLMTRNPARLPPQASVADALALMAERRISSVLVVEDDRAIGILSERDAIRLAGTGGDLRTTPLHERMSHPLHRIDPDRPAHEASLTMRTLRVRRLVVDDSAGRLLGILTRRDLLRDIQDVYVRLLPRVVAEQERLAAERRRLANIIAGTRAGTWEWEVQTGVTVFNERWAEIIGYRLEELTPTTIETWTRLGHPQDLKTSDALLQRHFRGELDTYECEVRIRHKDGHWVWVFDQGRVVSRGPAGEPLLMSGIHLDISERYRAQERLRESEARLSTVFENAPLGMALAGPDGRVTLANRALGAFLGCDPDLVVGMPVYGMSPPRERRQDRAILADLLAGRREGYRATKCYRRMDGREVWGDLRVALLPNRPGEPPSPLGMVEDVTELYTANARRQALEEALGRYTTQLEELVDLVNLPRPPRGQVRALLRLGCRSLGMTAAVLESLDGDQRERAAVRANGPPGRMPGLARPTLETFLDPRGQPRVLGSEHLPEATRAAGFASCIGLAFDSPRPEGPPHTLILTLWSTESTVNPGGPERQILRLIAQRVAALRHAERIQRDLVRAKERETIGHLASGVAHDFNNLLGVLDANLFEPLYSTKAKQRGHGLGLFMVQEFVSRSGAGLAVYSGPGAGTRFRLLLPGMERAEDQHPVHPPGRDAVVGLAHQAGQPAPA